MHKKGFNTFWILEKKILCKPGNTKEKKMKCRVAIRMVNETICKPYVDVIVSLKTKSHNEFLFKEMTRVIDVNDVCIINTHN